MESETKDPKKGYLALRRGRFSRANSDYFLTINLDRTIVRSAGATLLEVIFVS